MFKKKPQIKNLSPLRSSDRRKLADQIIFEYQIHVPAPPQSSDGDGANSQDQSLTTTLTSIRTSLLPENCLSARFTTHAGPDAKLVSGTLYVGSFSGQEERILWFQLRHSDQRVYPTVYTLWQNPGLVPLLHTQAFVVDKLQTGADLMTPGLTRGPPFPAKAKKNAIVAVASIAKPTVPVVVGVCEIDVSALEKVIGAKGHAVKGMHWEGDELWAWSHLGTGGRPSPDDIEGCGDSTSMAGLSKGVRGMAIDEDDDEGREEGGVSLNEPTHNNGHTDEQPQARIESEEQEPEPSTQEIDQAFCNAFLYALYNARKNGSPPHYGVDLPINPSFLISNLIQPYLLIHSTTQAQYYTIKKTSWKNTKKFIKHLDKQGLVKSKDRSGGETVINDVDFNDQQILDFTPYKLPKPKADNVGGANNQAPSKAANTSSSDPSLNQKFNLQTLIRSSPKLVPELLPSRTDFYTPNQVSTFLRTYFDQNPDLTSQSSSPRFIKLNPFLANNILGSGSNPSTRAADSKALASGEIARDVLQKRILEDTHLCQPYWVLLPGDQKWSSPSSSFPPSPSLPKPKSGPPPKLSLVLEKRTGTKTVTKVANLEVFAISPELLAAELQKKCASSTTVAQWVGGKPGQMEVLIQGDQRDVVQREVGRRGVEGRWIEVVDKASKKGKK